jgi:hypothetical protein
MRRMLGLTIAAALLVGSAVFPGPAGAVEPGTVPRIAVVRSAIAENTIGLSGSRMGHHYFRVDPIVTWLGTEFGAGNVTVIGDAELGDVNALRNFDTVVLVRQISFTAAQRLAVREYVAGGGGIVGMFGTGRWDYVPTRRPVYRRAIEIFPHLAWEWGELSELYGVSFYNDPLTSSSHRVVGRAPDAHPILQMTATQLGRVAPLDMAPNRADNNEYVRILPGAAVTPLLYYANAPCDGIPRNGNGWLAGWTSQYESGRVVYFGFQLYDVCGVMSQPSEDTEVQARALLFNSVRWAGTAKTYTPIVHAPRLSQKVRATRGTVRVSQSVSCASAVPLRGQFGLTIFDPSGKVRYRRTNTAWKMLSVGQSAKGPNWTVRIKRMQRGRWVARTTFKYWEYAKGGWVTGYRDVAFRIR